MSAGSAIGLDPSLTGFGWAVIYRNNLERCGVWGERAPSGGAKREGQTARVCDLIGQLLELLREEIQVANDAGQDLPLVFIESIEVVPMRFMTVAAMGRVHGIADGVARALGLEVIEVPATDVKRLANLGRVRKVSKAEVRTAVELLYPTARDLLPEGERGDNASDAVAIAHVGLERLKFTSRLAPGWSGP